MPPKPRPQRASVLASALLKRIEDPDNDNPKIAEEWDKFYKANGFANLPPMAWLMAAVKGKQIITFRIIINNPLVTTKLTDHEKFELLKEACNVGSLPMVKDLTKQHKTPVSLTPIGKTRQEHTLYTAVNKKHSRIVQYYADSKVDMAIPAPLKASLMHIAVRNNDLETAEILCKAKSPIDTHAQGGLTPLLMAIKECRYDMAELLIRYGASTNRADDQRQNPAHHACLVKSLEILKLVCENKANVNGWTLNHTTPLMIAARNGISIMVNYLHSKGAKGHHTDKQCRTAAHHAVEANHEDVYRNLIMNYGPTCFEPESPLHLAIINGQANIVKAAIEARDDLEKPTHKTMYGALHLAAIHNRVYIIRLLLKAQAEIEAQDSMARTPLALAVHHGNYEAAETLLKAGADPESRDVTTQTILIQAVKTGRHDMVELLLASPNLHNVNRKDTNGEGTALHHACMRGHKTIIRMLMVKGANPDILNDKDETCMDKAIESNLTDVIKQLEAWERHGHLVDRTIKPSLEGRVFQPPGPSYLRSETDEPPRIRLEDVEDHFLSPESRARKQRRERGFYTPPDETQESEPQPSTSRAATAAEQDRHGPTPPKQRRTAHEDPEAIEEEMESPESPSHSPPTPTASEIYSSRTGTPPSYTPSPRHTPSPQHSPSPSKGTKRRSSGAADDPVELNSDEEPKQKEPKQEEQPKPHKRLRPHRRVRQEKPKPDDKKKKAVEISSTSSSE